MTDLRWRTPTLTRLYDAAAEWLGIARSFRMYYASPRHTRRMTRFYAQFIRPGDLCFDIGAHVGSRVHVWSRLGARIVAVEPQPACLRVLRRWYGNRANVRLVGRALAAAPGRQRMLISRRTPTVTTLSREWASAVKRKQSFAGVHWDTEIDVPVTTLDSLIEQYGEPVFCKIDVEGYEHEVLQGLTRPLRCLSYEYIPGAVEFALVCLDRIQSLGEYEFNASSGESMAFEFPAWVNAAQAAVWLQARPVDDLPGDMYARLRASP